MHWPKGDIFKVDNEKIGAFVAQRRRALQMTQQQLAETLGVTNKAVSKWERGMGLPDITALPPLARALQISVDELLAGEMAPCTVKNVQEEYKHHSCTETVLPMKNTAPILTVDDIYTPQACRLASLAGRGTGKRRWVMRVLFGLLTLTAAGALWWAVQEDDIGLYALAATAGALAVLYGLEVFGGLLSRRNLRITARKRGARSASFFEQEVLLQSKGESTRLSYTGITEIWQGPQGLCLFWSMRALALCAHDVTEEKLQELCEHLHRQAPQAVWKQGKKRSKRQKVLAVLAVALCVLCAGAYGLGVRASVSLEGKLALFYKNPITGKTIHLRGMHAEQFPYAVQSGLKLQWLTGDVCAATYVGEDGRTHQYIATFGDRGSGISYYNVGTAITGEWAPADKNSAGWHLEASEGRNGHITLENGSYCYEYEYSECVQAGTLALALCKNGIPEWTVALGEDFVFQNNDSGSVAAGGSIVVYRVSMEKTAPVAMDYIG